MTSEDAYRIGMAVLMYFRCDDRVAFFEGEYPHLVSEAERLYNLFSSWEEEEREPHEYI